ncbi:MAG TPA: DinB family protein [Pyrinomonadaceae bacterium]|nr:DinB family protein [Pyrinomonadaceae bacterium]
MSAMAPAASEYAPYFEKYVSLVPAGDVVETLERQAAGTLALLRGLDEEKAGSRYEPGKWSIKEVVGHLVDAERVFAYRALCFARGDRTPLPGFEQDDYVRGGNFDARPINDLADEFDAVRRATVALFRRLDEETWQRTGTASGNPFTVRALAHIIAGHELHHLGVLKTKYL